jgi:hypothetical protein
MYAFRLAVPSFVAVVGGCSYQTAVEPGEEEGASDDSADADADADSDSDSDADTGDSAEVEDTGEEDTEVITDDDNDLVGTLTYYSTLDGELACDSTGTLTAGPFVGDCEGCSFAFGSTDLAWDSEDGTEACAYNPLLSFVSNGLLVPNSLAIIPEYVYYYYSYYTYTYYYLYYTDILAMGVAVDYTNYGYGYYPGPYWAWMAWDGTYNDSVYGTWEAGTGSILFDYDRSYAYTVTTINYTDYSAACAGYEASYASGAYEGAASATDDVACDPQGADIWTFQVAAGETITVTVDTVDAATAFLPWMMLNGPDECLDVYAIDNFTCAFPPASGYGCPSIEYQVPTDGEYTLVVAPYYGYPDCAGDVGGYALTVGATLSTPEISLAADDAAALTQVDHTLVTQVTLEATYE